MRRRNVGCLLLALSAVGPEALAQQRVFIDVDHDLGPVNRDVFGGDFEFITSQAPETIALASGMPFARYPGGDADSTFYWTDGPLTDGIYPSFDWAAYAPLARQNRTRLFLEANVVRGNPYAAVSWLNDARGRGLQVPWMGVGNEPWGDWDAGYYRYGPAGSDPQVHARAYAADVRQYADVVHRLAPGTGVALEVGTHNEDVWNRAAVRAAGGAIDAIDYHFYPNHYDCSPGWYCPSALQVAAGADSVRPNLQRLRRMIQEESPADARRVQILIGEWDGAADVSFPLTPGFHYLQWSMADALFYGAAIGEMLVGEVAAAAHYEVQGRRFGLVGGNYAVPWDLSIHRPKEFALRLWRERFGDRLLRVQTGVEDCEAPAPGPSNPPGHSEDARYFRRDDHRHGRGVTSPWHGGGGDRRCREVPGFVSDVPTDWDGQPGWVPYVRTYASSADRGGSVRMIVVNRHPTDVMPVDYRFGDFDPSPTADVWCVAGRSIDDMNENLGGPIDAVRLEHATARAEAQRFVFQAPAHSVCAVRLDRRRR
jgi:hypothetical protein